MTRENLDKPLIHLFMHIGKLLNDRLRDTLGERGIHFGQARILTALLAHGTLAQGDIGRGLHIKPATVTNLVQKMETSGLIDRRRDSGDDRVIKVTLTPNGKEAATFAEKVIVQIEKDIRSEFSQEEIYMLCSPLIKIRNRLGGSDPTI